VAETDGKWAVVLDGKAGELYEGLDVLVFRLDDRRALVATEDVLQLSLHNKRSKIGPPRIRILS
jgi:hypothetical protein